MRLHYPNLPICREELVREFDSNCSRAKCRQRMRGSDWSRDPSCNDFAREFPERDAAK